MNKIVLITGTSTGLGQSLAIQLAQKNHKVYATMRNLDKQEGLLSAAKAAGVTLEVKQLDVQSTESVERCVGEILEQEGRLDVLVNNAGAGFVRTTEQATEDEINWVMDVNFLGVVRCTKAVLPHMRQARKGHIVNITSVGGLVGQPFNEFYCAAKFAVEGYTESQSTYITPHFGVNFTLVEPGGISSEFANSALQQFMSQGGMTDDEYKPLLETYIAGHQARHQSNVVQTPDQVAEVVVNCIENPHPPLRTRTSEWSETFCQTKTQADPDGTKLQQHLVASFFPKD